MPENKGRKRAATSTEPSVPDSVKRLSKVRLPPPAVPNKPLTPFSIRDILNSKSSRQNHRRAQRELPSPADGLARLPNRSVREETTSGSSSSGARNGGHNPLNALEELTQETFKGLEENIIKTAEAANDGKRSHLGLFSQRQPPRRKRKSRTAFSNHQLFELERRFLYQKYLSPGDRDEIASSLGLTSSQVITWFQNRRAKLKRDIEEMKNDLSAAEKLAPHQSLVDIEGDDDSGANRSDSADDTVDEDL